MNPLLAIGAGFYYYYCIMTRKCSSDVRFLPASVFSINDTLCLFFHCSELCNMSQLELFHAQSIVRHFFVFSDRGNKRKMRDLVKEFSSLCRGMIGSEYAAVSNHFL